MENSFFYSSSTHAPQVTPSKDAHVIVAGSHYGALLTGSFNKPTHATKYANPMDGDFDMTPLPFGSLPAYDAYNAELQQQLHETKKRLHKAQLQVFQTKQQLGAMTQDRDDYKNQNRELIRNHKRELAQERAMQESRSQRILQNERNKTNQAFKNFLSFTLTKGMDLFPSQLVADDKDVVSNCIVGAMLGEGAFGDVVKGTQLKTGKQVAIKLVDSHCEFIKDEINVLQRIDHPNVIKLNDVLWDVPANTCGLVFELGFVDLQVWTQNGNIIPLEGARQITRALIKALSYLHSQNIGHMDVKKENIMIMCQHLVESNIKLCDMGLATTTVEDNQFRGTPELFAPEVCGDDTKYYKCAAADMWSCGATIVDMLEHLPVSWKETYDLYNDPEDIGHTAFQNGLKLHVARMNQTDYGLDSHAMHLALSLLVYKPEHRLTAQQALGHPWLQDYEP